MNIARVSEIRLSSSNKHSPDILSITPHTKVKMGDFRSRPSLKKRVESCSSTVR